MNIKQNEIRRKLLPFLLTVAIFTLDQFTKWLVVTYIPPYTIGAQFFGDFFRIIHVYNPGIAFSIGATLSDSVRSIFFAFIPLIVLIAVIVIYFKNNDFTAFQRWSIAGVLGGGLGTLYDRFFRSEGVVDFLDFKFYGIFGFERWPTFNVSDMAVLICGGLLLISFAISIKNESKQQKEERT